MNTYQNRAFGGGERTVTSINNKSKLAFNSIGVEINYEHAALDGYSQLLFFPPCSSNVHPMSSKTIILLVETFYAVCGLNGDNTVF